MSQEQYTFFEAAAKPFFRRFWYADSAGSRSSDEYLCGKTLCMCSVCHLPGSQLASTNADLTSEIGAPLFSRRSFTRAIDPAAMAYALLPSSGSCSLPHPQRLASIGTSLGSISTGDSQLKALRSCTVQALAPRRVSWCA